MTLLRKTSVATVPGDALFDGGRAESFVRLCFAKVGDELRECCKRIEGPERGRP